MQNARLYALVGGTVGGVCLPSVFTYAWQSGVFQCLIFVMSIIVMSVVFRHHILNFFKKPEQRIILIMILVGLSLGFIRAEIWMSFNHKGVLQDLVNKKVLVVGRVVEEPQASDGSTKIILQTVVSSSSPKSAKILLTADRYSQVVYGDEIKVYGKVVEPKPIKSVDGDFAYDIYLARQGIFYTITFPSISILAHNHANILRGNLIKIKNSFLGKIDEIFVAPKSGLLAGLLISGRSSLSKSEQNLFTKAGLIHIVALSGFNVTIIAQGLMLLLIFLPKKVRLIIGAVGIIAFVTMTGFGATIVRAGIMALLVIFAALVYRMYDVGRALFIAVLVMTLWNPMVVYDVSFQLSCIATFAVIFAVPYALIKYQNKFNFLPEKFKIRETMLGTAVIEIFLLPILLSTAGQISLVTVVTNLLVLPILPVVMGFGFLATLLGFVNYFLALPIIALSNILLSYILLITNFFANVPFGVFSFSISKWMVGGMYIGLAFWLYQLQKNAPTKNPASIFDTGPSVYNSAFTQQNVQRVQNFLQSHSSSSFQKKQ